MGKKDPRVDAYIAEAPDFAKPILARIRAKVHEAVPDVVETIKWSVPAFDYQGPMAGVAAFKAHIRFGFWRGGTVGGKAIPSMERIESIKDLPSDRELIRTIKRAAQMNESGVKMARPTTPKPPVKVPSYVLEAIRTNKKALAAFEAFSHSHKREYVEWITDARAEATRQRRLETAVQWIAEGKSRNWKYVRR